MSFRELGATLKKKYIPYLFMRLSYITIQGFKSFAKKTTIDVTHQVTGVVGPNGSGKSNIAEAIRFVLGEQSMKSMRGKTGSDVIFKGSEHLSSMSRASVTMVIDNRKKDALKKAQSSSNPVISDSLAPYLVYEHLTLSRTIYADGTSDYTLNDAKVRLKDVQELLSFAGIGGSAHTIINQGEADRILLASPKDRKEALEDALGLRVYHLRLAESTRKLEKVKTHVREVELLRTEIKPHLDHLGRQVKKIESQEEERKNLHGLLVAYFHKEDGDLAALRERIHEEGTSDSLLVVTQSIEKELAILTEQKKDIKSKQDLGISAEKNRLHAELRLLLERKDQVIKTLGRLEGEEAVLEKQISKDREVTSVTIPMTEVKISHITIINRLSFLTQALNESDIPKASILTNEVTQATHEFFNKYTNADTTKQESIQNEIKVIIDSIEEHESTLTFLSLEIAKLEGQIEALGTQVEQTVVTRHEEEKKIMLLESKLRELKSTINLRKQEESELDLRSNHSSSLLKEGMIIVGQHMQGYKEIQPLEKYRDTQKHDLMRGIERSKLRIEEAGIPNKDEVIKEFTTTKERDEYLLKELSDIKESERNLLILIDELRSTLSSRFSQGVQEVSKVFSTFFGEVFVGGRAKIVLVTSTKMDEEGKEIQEQGIDLDVSLPNKKVKEISMFSGGERALVSIALLFAMSAITPPPFMVLDETDAPLDESNARKYGAMLKRLSEHSKLLVITHNRETMNHCDMLYGVTIGVDGGSKLLSINFKEAERLAE
jgi:chromosome segregation protein